MNGKFLRRPSNIMDSDATPTLPLSPLSLERMTYLYKSVQKDYNDSRESVKETNKRQAHVKTMANFTKITLEGKKRNKAQANKEKLAFEGTTLGNKQTWGTAETDLTPEDDAMWVQLYTRYKHTDEEEKKAYETWLDWECKIVRHSHNLLYIKLVEEEKLLEYIQDHINVLECTPDRSEVSSPLCKKIESGGGFSCKWVLDWTAD
eukprot:2793371-Rhodomonas_salina.1